MAKILFIQPGFAHYRRDLFDLFHESHEVTFVFLRIMNSYPSETGPNAQWNMIFLNKEKSWFWVYALVGVILKSKPDLIIVSNNGSWQSIASGITANVLRIPVILWSEAWEMPLLSLSKPFWKRWIKEARVRISAKTASAVVASGKKSSIYNRKYLSGLIPVFQAYQSTRDLRELSTETAIPDKAPNVIEILYLSRIVRLKGLDYLIHAFSLLEEEHNNVKLTIVGDGPFLKECRELSEKLDVGNITFEGSVPNEKTRAYYERADIFVLPNSGIGGIEGWGLVLNEAASMGLPIITTDAVGAAGDLVIQDVNGLIINPASIQELKQSLEKLVTNDILRNKMGIASRKLFEKLNNYEKMFMSFQDAISTVRTEI